MPCFSVRGWCAKDVCPTVYPYGLFLVDWMSWAFLRLKTSVYRSSSFSTIQWQLFFLFWQCFIPTWMPTLIYIGTTFSLTLHFTIYRPHFTNHLTTIYPCTVIELPSCWTATCHALDCTFISLWYHYQFLFFSALLFDCASAYYFYGSVITVWRETIFRCLCGVSLCNGES
jgi:hypothetical protein